VGGGAVAGRLMPRVVFSVHGTREVLTGGLLPGVAVLPQCMGGVHRTPADVDVFCQCIMWELTGGRPPTDLLHKCCVVGVHDMGEVP
jgi:hypothetical protein